MKSATNKSTPLPAERAYRCIWSTALTSWYMNFLHTASAMNCFLPANVNGQTHATKFKQRTEVFDSDIHRSMYVPLLLRTPLFLSLSSLSLSLSRYNISFCLTVIFLLICEIICTSRPTMRTHTPNSPGFPLQTWYTLLRINPELGEVPSLRLGWFTMQLARRARLILPGFLPSVFPWPHPLLPHPHLPTQSPNRLHTKSDRCV